MRGISMFEMLNHDLVEIREKIRRKEKLISRLQRVKDSIQKHTSNLYEFEYKMNQEKADVEELEGLSVSSLIAALLRNKEDKQKKEKEEYILAKLKYDECLSLIEALRLEKTSLEIELSGFENLYELYESVLRRKEELIMGTNNRSKLKLIELAEEISELQADKRELKEAVFSGKQVSEELIKLLENFDIADSWGTWDILGGGLIATSIKHDYINSAKENSYALNKLMETFKGELLDISIESDIKIDISGFEVFMDYFFDGFFIDWMVKNKIEDSYGNARKLSEKIEDILRGLETSKEIICQRIDWLQGKRREIIEQG
jgi:hypothetical protein